MLIYLIFRLGSYLFLHFIDISTIFVSMKSTSQLIPLEQTVFYTLDKAIKTYRQFAQRNIKRNNLDITIDQWLILKTIYDNPELTQRDIATRVFKDYASITRIIEILVQRHYLERRFHNADRRRYHLTLTTAGKKIYKKLVTIVQENRSAALNDLDQREITLLNSVLNKIILNCN